MADIDIDDLSTSELFVLEFRIQTRYLVKQGEELIQRDIYKQRIVTDTPNLLKRFKERYNERSTHPMRDRTLAEILEPNYDFFIRMDLMHRTTAVTMDYIEKYLIKIVERETGKPISRTNDNQATYPYYWHDRIKTITIAMIEQSFKSQKSC